MNSTDNAVGMMDGAYFTGRRELLIFFNELLHLNLSKIEETATGAVACQLLEYIYPGSIPMKRVNWQAKNDYEYVQNYKLLQAAFDKHRISKHIDVDRLIRAKYQDNLEFCQWLKAFFDQAASGLEREDYDPVAVRSKGKGGKAPSIGASKQRTTSTSTTAPKKYISTGAVRRVTTTTNTTKPSKADMPFASPQPEKNKENIQNLSAVKDYASTTKTRPSSARMLSTTPARMASKTTNESILADAKLLKENDDLRRENSELKVLLAEAEREQKFYYDKLRSIEMTMDKYEHKKLNGDDDIEFLITGVKEGLYAPDEDQIPLEDKLLNEEEYMDLTAISQAEIDTSVESSIQNKQSALESSSDILEREMMQTAVDDDGEPSLMIQDSADSVIDEI